MNDYFKELLADKNSGLAYDTIMQTPARVTPGPVFIVLSGKKQVGKDTATELMKYALERAGKRVAVTAFAKPLKDMCVNILGLTKEQVYGTNAQKDSLTKIQWDTLPHEIRLKHSAVSIGDPLPPLRSGAMTAREVLQVVGTDLFRNMLFNDVWAQAPFIQEWDCDVVIITDCRFPNEKLAAEANNSIVIRLERNTGLEDTHISETALDGHGFGIMYYNNGTIEQLRDFSESILQRWNLL